MQKKLCARMGDGSQSHDVLVSSACKVCLKYSLKKINTPLSFVSFHGGSVVKKLLATQEMQKIRVRSLDGEDPLGMRVKTHSSVVAWEIPWTEEPVGLESTGSQRVGHD